MGIKRRYNEDAGYIRGGRMTVIETRTPESSKRFEELEDIMYQTYMVHFPQTSRPQGWVWKKAEAKVKELAMAGGTEYDRAKFLVKQSWVSPEDFQKAVKFLS